MHPLYTGGPLWPILCITHGRNYPSHIRQSVVRVSNLSDTGMHALVHGHTSCAVHL